MRQVLLIILLACATASAAYAQASPPYVFSDAPLAYWIAPPGITGSEYGVYHFRKSVDLETAPDRFVVHISGDNRYRLLVNGQSVSAGPQRSDLMHWRFETVDLAPYLQAGENILAAVVWNWGPHLPAAQFTHRTAFLLQGDSPLEAALVNSNETWKVWRDWAYAPLAVSRDQVRGYYAAPPGESFDGTKYPWGWETANFSDDQWQNAAVTEGWGADVTRLRATTFTGEGAKWQLVPRTIPQMEERPVRFDRVRRAEGIETDGAFLRGGGGGGGSGSGSGSATGGGSGSGSGSATGGGSGSGSGSATGGGSGSGSGSATGSGSGDGDLLIPPNASASVLIDQGHLTNAYAVLETSGGAGSTITLTYAEALHDANGQKGNRNEIEGKTIGGIQDIFLPDGADHRRYQTLWFRTYRYVQLEIETGAQELQIHDLSGVFTGYPFELKASFESDLDWLADVWEIDWRVARLCAWETYFDTPYYEQLQYIGDTRIQALITLYMTGDARLVRQAISHFDVSRIPEGITASRYPSELAQYIPTFSLIWIAMVHDFWMHRDDEAYVASMLPGIRGVIGWFEKLVDDTGLVGPVPWWPYADWAEGWGYGNPPGAKDGHSVLITLQYAYALQRAADLEEHLGYPEEGARNRDRAEAAVAAVRSRAWDRDRGLFKDALELESASQQTNTLALLVGAVPSPDQADFLHRVLADSSLTQATYYFGFYVLEALREAGLAEEYIDHLGPWQQMLALGLTTTAESPEPTRSDSHAWAAHPNYGLLATVLGVRPAEPGFRSVHIEPALGPLERAEGVVPHEKGLIRVQVERSGGDGLRAMIELPDGLEGTFQWRGQWTTLHAGLQEIEY